MGVHMLEVAVKSRSGAPSREACVVGGHTTVKASNA